MVQTTTTRTDRVFSIVMLYLLVMAIDTMVKLAFNGDVVVLLGRTTWLFGALALALNLEAKYYLWLFRPIIPAIQIVLCILFGFFGTLFAYNCYTSCGIQVHDLGKIFTPLF